MKSRVTPDCYCLGARGKMSINNLAMAQIDHETNKSDLEPISQASPGITAPANKKLSESRLRLAAIQSLSTQVETEITLKEAIRGTSRTFTVLDQNCFLFSIFDFPLVSMRNQKLPLTVFSF